MNFSDWRWTKRLKELLVTRQPEPTRQAERITAMQLHIVLPAKAGIIAVVLYYLFYSGWFDGVYTTRTVVLETLQEYFLAYILGNVVAFVLFLLWQRFPPGIFQWLVFTLGLLDGLFIAGLTAVTGGFDSIAYWVFPGLILLNAISIPLAMPQIVLNLLLTVFYLSAGFLNANIPEEFTLRYGPGRSTVRAVTELPADGLHHANNLNLTNGVAGSEGSDRAVRRNKAPWWNDSGVEGREPEALTEPISLRVFVLLLLTACCYGVQLLVQRQRQAFEEEQEFAVREAQLRSAGRFAAEFTHQIKNPLAIINNAVFSIQRALKEGRSDVAPQIEIIQEEVERSDRIVTQIMGYAQLTEGHVEKLNVAEELDRAVEQVFPAAMESGIHIERLYGPDFPPLLMQRRHLSDSFVNLLQNAREALNDTGRVSVSAVCHADSSIEIAIQDNGPGIPEDKLGRIFEAYYTTREKGTGLGLAIVKHNVELYAGTVRIESELGKGARFILTFPAKTVTGLAKSK